MFLKFRFYEQFDYENIWSTTHDAVLRIIAKKEEANDSLLNIQQELDESTTNNSSNSCIRLDSRDKGEEELEPLVFDSHNNLN